MTLTEELRPTTSLSKIGKRIHDMESRLWHIAKAEQGQMPYVLQYKDIKKRQRIRERVEAELETLYQERDKFKATVPKSEWYPKRKRCGRTKGAQTKYTCSDGRQVNQNQIDVLRSAAYKDKYSACPQPMLCCGCRNGYAKGSAHIIAQARCKQIHKTELIWHHDNFFPGCHACNRAIENPKGEAWKSLLNKDKCLEFIKLHDAELHAKFINNPVI